MEINSALYRLSNDCSFGTSKGRSKKRREAARRASKLPIVKATPHPDRTVHFRNVTSRVDAGSELTNFYALASNFPCYPFPRQSGARQLIDFAVVWLDLEANGVDAAGGCSRTR